MPKISEATATMTSITIRLPDEIISTTSASTSPTPVSVTVPTMIPAVDVAIATPIMLRAPIVRPTSTSTTPCLACAATSFRPKNQAWRGRCVSKTKIRKTVAQKADSAGESSSIIRFQISTATGSRKWMPLLSVGPGSGSSMIG